MQYFSAYKEYSIVLTFCEKGHENFSVNAYCLEVLTNLTRVSEKEFYANLRIVL